MAALKVVARCFIPPRRSKVEAEGLAFSLLKVVARCFIPPQRSKVEAEGLAFSLQLI